MEGSKKDSKTQNPDYFFKTGDDQIDFMCQGEKTKLDYLIENAGTNEIKKDKEQKENDYDPVFLFLNLNMRKSH
ncbi:MAG: hypothetical protein AAB267_09100 [Candidatus Desantisbacteria bacterium]|mgnify:CR=1 FL=1